jgi:hypothetical protein
MKGMKIITLEEHYSNAAIDKAVQKELSPKLSIII